MQNINPMPGCKNFPHPGWKIFAQFGKKLDLQTGLEKCISVCKIIVFDSYVYLLEFACVMIWFQIIGVLQFLTTYQLEGRTPFRRIQIWDSFKYSNNINLRLCRLSLGSLHGESQFNVWKIFICYDRVRCLNSSQLPWQFLASWSESDYYESYFVLTTLELV